MVKTFNLTLGEALVKASLFLREQGHDEALARTYWLMTFDKSLTELVLKLNQPMEESDFQYFFDVLARIVKDEPIQYIVGHAYFMGEKFKVNQHTLIPREETAGIIDLVSPTLNSLSQAKVLDIGTGTAILPIILAKHFPKAQISASDISVDALDVARENARDHKVNIHFYASDLFKDIPSERFDVIISNPPYISKSELDLMDESVKKYEPSLALFAEDNGLAIYKELVLQSEKYLSKQGLIVVEIGFQQGQSVSELFQDTYPGAKIEVIKDYNDNDRYVQVQL